MRLREASISDLHELTKLFELYRVFYGKPEDYNTASSFISQRLINRDSVFFIIEVDEEIIGFTQLYPLFSSTRMQKLWLLNDLYILDAHRGKGYSKQLIEKAQHYCKLTNAVGLLLETQKSNMIGNELYPKMGFHLEDDVNYYFWNNDK